MQGGCAIILMWAGSAAGGASINRVQKMEVIA